MLTTTPDALNANVLLTAEIAYRMPDFRNIVQIFIWQKPDIVPGYPNLEAFLDFWDRDIEGPIHSVRIVRGRLILPGEVRVRAGHVILH